MRAIKYIAIHCTATSQNTSISAIQSYWKNQLGWKMPGYHFIVKPDGETVNLLPIEQVSNGVKGFNSQTINISYIGGIDLNNAPKDTRTPAQKASILKLLKDFKQKFPTATIQGHRDFPNVHKACPSFDAKKEYKDV
ncbi:N-acetylmuramoyl-L-alanine amidase [Flavobacterium soyangense]|uniref:N-acetylmuramoyl-L-alanine amidase n=1 Tax=Flavobacterium soyangense TaxID=2023265 RepID=A0A930XTI5_9FLAO|nr:N-acetylmuramoyl-L-alanine amidase [Flavobacterium soyangense]MBF2707520.1 N-acetylmuramoyl-L-alanine amidase [Flavobacterium soyangense]